MAKGKSKSLSTEKRVLGYVRVSTTDQADHGVSLSAQVAAIRSECERNGWELVGIVEDAGVSAKSLDRPGLSRALNMLRLGEANVLMVAKQDRLSRNALDTLNIADMAGFYGFELALLDAPIDMTTPNGRFILTVQAAIAEQQRGYIRERTREALQEKKRQGVKLGRPVSVPVSTVDHIRKMRGQGITLRGIAEALNRGGLETGHGGARWHASTVKAVLDRVEVPAA